MNPLIVPLPGNEAVARRLIRHLPMPSGKATLRRLPGGEMGVRLDGVVKGHDVVLVCNLARPDDQFLRLLLVAETARELGATSVGLVTPFLPYTRNPRRLPAGEGSTAIHFGAALSRMFDWIVTVDPHLNAGPALARIYRIPVIAAHTGALIADWVRDNVPCPVIVGPSRQNAQWAAAVARTGGAFLVLNERSRGRSSRNAVQRRLATPVLVDDIIATGRTMQRTVERLRSMGYPRPVCVATHAVLADGAEVRIRKSGACRIVTTNTIAHRSNAIDVTPLLVEAMRQVRATLMLPGSAKAARVDHRPPRTHGRRTRAGSVQKATLRHQGAKTGQP